MSEDGRPARVLLVDRDPPGVIDLGGAEERALLLEAISDIDKRKRSIETMELIAWTSKAKALSVRHGSMKKFLFSSPGRPPQVRRCITFRATSSSRFGKRGDGNPG